MTQDGPKVLIIEDEPEIRRFLRVSLTHHGYRLAEAENGRQGILEAATIQPDLVVLDLGLPDVDGLQVIAEVRGWSRVPIIVLSARGQDDDKVAALDAGADDYLTKPFSVVELLARIRAALRRVNAVAGEPVFMALHLRVDLARRQVFVHDREVHLTPTEYRLLSTLIRDAGKVLTHRHLLKEVWGPDAAFENHYLRVFMAQLRRKIEDDPGDPRIIITEPAVGYRLVSD